MAWIVRANIPEFYYIILAFADSDQNFLSGDRAVVPLEVEIDAPSVTASALRTQLHFAQTDAYSSTVVHIAHERWPTVILLLCFLVSREQEWGSPTYY